MRDTAPRPRTLNPALSTSFEQVIVRLLETYVSPKFGWLIGLAKAPAYSKPDTSASELAFREIKDEVLIGISESTEDDLFAQIQAARSRAGLPPL